jgi:DNA-binding LytR/AlgR family response regulator
MKVVIIEDEHLAAAKLEKMIIQYDSEIEVEENLDSVDSAVEWLSSNESPDLLFLDIQLTDGTCFDILKQVTINCPVIFTTAYDQYALEAFNLQSIDYLIKPVSQEKLNKALDKMNQMRKNLSWQNSDLERILRTVEQANDKFKSRFLIKSGSSMHSVAVDGVAYFYSEDKLVFMKTRDAKRHIVNETLEELESALNPSEFFRINRQYIVHIQAIEKVHPHFKGRLKIELKPAPSEEVFISNRRATPFKDWMNQ